MKEKEFNKENFGDSKKLDWDPPKLIILEKDKTNGGTGIGTETFTTYPGS